MDGGAGGFPRGEEPGHDGVGVLGGGAEDLAADVGGDAAFWKKFFFLEIKERSRSRLRFEFFSSSFARFIFFLFVSLSL